MLFPCHPKRSRNANGGITPADGSNCHGKGKALHRFDTVDLSQDKNQTDADQNSKVGIDGSRHGLGDGKIGHRFYGLLRIFLEVFPNPVVYDDGIINGISDDGQCHCYKGIPNGDPEDDTCDIHHHKVMKQSHQSHNSCGKAPNPAEAKPHINHHQDRGQQNCLDAVGEKFLSESTMVDSESFSFASGNSFFSATSSFS